MSRLDTSGLVDMNEREPLPTQAPDVPVRSVGTVSSDQKDTGTVRAGSCRSCYFFKRRSYAYGTCYYHQASSGFFAKTFEDASCEAFTPKAVIVGR